MHLTETASHCVSGLNSLCALCIFRCLYAQILFKLYQLCHFMEKKENAS